MDVGFCLYVQVGQEGREELIPFSKHVFNTRRVRDVTYKRVGGLQEDMKRGSQLEQGRAALPGTRNAEDQVFWCRGDVAVNLGNILHKPTARRALQEGGREVWTRVQETAST